MTLTIRMARAVGALLLAGCAGAANPRERASAQVVQGDTLRFPAPARPISAIVAPQWTAEPYRDRTGEAAKVLDALGVAAGTRLADIGAGTGYYVVRASARVGPSGLVFAQDIMPEYLADLRARVSAEGLGNVRVIAGTPDDPGLPPDSVDVALLSHMYHEIENPYALLWHLRGSLAPGGRVGVIDMDAPTTRHGTPPALLRCEFAALGFREVRTFDLAPADGYLAIFEAAAPRPAPAAIRPCPHGDR